MDKYINGIKRFINKNINKQNTKEFLLNHKNTLIVIVAIILLGGITTIISYAYFTIVANQSIVGGQVGSIANINMYYFVEDKNASTGAGLGTYSKSVYVPRTTYTYNSSLSYCKHGSTLSYNASTYTFTVSKTKDACYAYFDVSESKNADIVLNMYMQKNGEYKLINEIPSGYTIDTTQSSCTNGATMTLDNGEITVNTTNKTVCNAYLLPPSYWNDNFSGTTYTYPFSQKKVYGGSSWTSGSPTVYTSLSALRSNYANFSTTSVYVKTSTKHQTCLYHNNHELCLDPNFWEGTGNSSNEQYNTMTKLRTTAQTALGITISSDYCYYNADETMCNIDESFYCYVYYNGNVGCYSDSTDNGCVVFSDGTATCISYSDYSDLYL